jgi:hypothetical protein
MKTLLILSIIIAMIMVAICLKKYLKINRSLNCWGVVCEMPESDGENSTVYGVVAKFVAHDGNEYTYKSSYKSSNPSYSMGDGIRIYYDPNDPTDNGVMSFMGAYGFYFVVLCISSITAIILVCSLYSYKIMDIIHSSSINKVEITRENNRF